VDGEVVEKDDGKDDPADGEEAVARAVAGCGKGQADWHVEEERGYGERGNEAGERGDVSLDAQDRECSEEHKNG